MQIKHLPHLEDLMFEGQEGFDKIKKVMDALWRSDMTHFSLKYDGAPAVFFGTDPRDDKKFVAKKSIFNKKPIIYKSHEDIDGHISDPVLRVKMKRCFDVLPRVDGVVQCELLWSHNSELTDTVLNGEEHVTFHPNVIRYHVKRSSSEYQPIRTARMGLVAHTFYAIDEDLVLTPRPMFSFMSWMPDDVVVFWPGQPRLLRPIGPMFYDATWSIGHPLDFTTAEDRASLNKYVRESSAFPRYDGFTMAYSEVSRTKDDVLYVLMKNLESADEFKQTFKVGDYEPETQHEGLVYNDGEFACKLVNRRSFSYANFSTDFVKGWSFNK